MKHDYIDILHDRLSQHEMTEPSGLWQEIENEMFNVGQVITTTGVKRRKQHKIGELVRISFISQDNYSSNKYSSIILPFCSLLSGYLLRISRKLS